MDDKPVPLRKIGYVVDQTGAVEVYRPPAPPAPPAKPLSRPERIDAYRTGIRKTSDALVALGFQPHYTAEHTASMEFRGYLFDFRIQRPSQVAHVTSSQTKPGTRSASIYKLSDEIKSEFALQMIIGKEFSARPLYVALDENLADPAQHIYDAVMGFLASLNERQHRLGQATVGRKPQLTTGPKELPEWLNV